MSSKPKQQQLAKAASDSQEETDESFDMDSAEEEYLRQYGAHGGYDDDDDMDDEDEDEPKSHFFGYQLGASSSESFELQKVNLHLTRLVMDLEATSKGHQKEGLHATISAVTPRIPNKVVLAHLNTPNNPQVLIDSAFFSHDDQVQLFNDGNVPVHVSGVLEIQPGDSDDDDEEDDEDGLGEDALDEEDDDEEEEEEKKEETNVMTTPDSSKVGQKRTADSQADTSESEQKLTKSQKKKLKKQRQEEAKAQQQDSQSEEKSGSQKKTPQKEKSESEGAEAAKTPKSSAFSKKHPVHTAKHGLKYQDLEVGMGKAPDSGKKVQIKYTGKLESGKTFDSNDNFTFRLGMGKVIKGMDIGVQTMRVGGTRRLVVPPSLGYGSKGAGNVIPPNATLVFDVTLKKAY